MGRRRGKGVRGVPDEGGVVFGRSRFVPVGDEGRIELNPNHTLEISFVSFAGRGRRRDLLRIEVNLVRRSN